MEHKFKLGWLVVNYACNNKCVYCYAGCETGEKNKLEMPANLLEGSVELFRDLGIKQVLFIGGEPTLYPRLNQGISLAKKAEMKPVGVVTNGRRLKNKGYLESLIDSGLDYFAISIEGPDATVHDGVTKVAGSFSNTLSGLENCLKLGISVGTETTICPMNRQYLHNILMLLKNRGLKVASFNLCSPSFDNLESSYTVSLIEGAKIIQELYQFGQTIGIDVKSVTPMPKCNFEPSIWEEMRRKRLVSTSCHVLYGTNFAVDYNGGILPCVHFSGKPMMSIYGNQGNIKDTEQFREELLAQGGLPTRLRDTLWQYPQKDCSDYQCFGNECVGGCPVFRLSKLDPHQQIKGRSRTLLVIPV